MLTIPWICSYLLMIKYDMISLSSQYYQQSLHLLYKYQQDKLYPCIHRNYLCLHLYITQLFQYLDYKGPYQPADHTTGHQQELLLSPISPLANRMIYFHQSYNNTVSYKPTGLTTPIATAGLTTAGLTDYSYCYCYY